MKSSALLSFLSCVFILFFISFSDADTFVQFGREFPSIPKKRVEKLLLDLDPRTTILPFDATPSPQSLPCGSLILSFGNASYANLVINKEDLKKVGSEGFLVESKTYECGSGKNILIAGDGNSETTFPLPKVNIGVLYATYTILESLGFAFFHPLEPTVPPRLSIPTNLPQLREIPRWPFRTWHLHTEHPLEVTEMLNGLAMNLSTDRGEWEAMLPEWSSFLEWMIANRQNRVEWILLIDHPWREFGESKERQQRLSLLTDMCHQWGIQAGADIPISNVQQHGWYMVSNNGTWESQVKRIRDRLIWLVDAGFDFLSTESGFSEFTHPDDRLMLAWMNTTVDVFTGQYNLSVYIKIHCSTGQTCDNFKDPRTGEPLNFNFLPMYADPRLGIYPHTVQMYTFDDPTSGSYGNKDFSYMFDFLVDQLGKRSVVYFGETAYWVNYDIDVPLFLPLYAAARLSDLRKIAKVEEAKGLKMDGQCNFDSGWEWGYWLNDVITARAAWDPLMSQSDDEALKSFLRLITRVFGTVSKEVEQILFDMIRDEHELLVLGRVANHTLDDTFKLNGQAYLIGWDTWSELGCGLTSIGCTQPVRLGLGEMRLPWATPSYKKVKPLLVAMETTFSGYLRKLRELTPKIPKEALPLWNDIVDTTEMTALRAIQVNSLYAYVAGWGQEHPTDREAHLRRARETIHNASLVVAEREKHYRVPVERIAGWEHNNPTAYSYGYLWTVHSLFYFWRDLGIAYMGSLETLSPCYLNIINPADVAFGHGIPLSVAQMIHDLLKKLNLGYIAECFEAPKDEPHYSFPPKFNKLNSVQL